uniref:Uncharacterized protein n=1 Tax=Octopus bimaculoides TaxID=37653 RepID=A0A0L8HN96_OCTBM
MVDLLVRTPDSVAWKVENYLQTKDRTRKLETEF